MKNSLSIILLVIGTSMLAQVNDTVTWRMSYRLTWDDFKAAPQAGNTRAWTGSAITYSAKQVGNSIVGTVVSYFERQRSWAQTAFTTDYTLRHEQGHFDLYEIYARKLRKCLAEKTFKRKTLNRDYQKIANKIIKKAQAQQKKYDKDTGFALNETNQKKWSEKIARELKELQAYESSVIILSVK